MRPEFGWLKLGKIRNGYPAVQCHIMLHCLHTSSNCIIQLVTTKVNETWLESCKHLSHHCTKAFIEVIGRLYGMQGFLLFLQLSWYWYSFYINLTSPHSQCWSRNTKSGHISRTSGARHGWCHCLGPGRLLMRWISDSPNESIITIKWFLWSHTQQTIQMFAVLGKQDSGFAVVCCFCHVEYAGCPWLYDNALRWQYSSIKHRPTTMNALSISMGFSAKLLSSPCDYVLCTSHQRTTSFGPNPKLVVSSCHYIMLHRWHLSKLQWLQVFQQHS